MPPKFGGGGKKCAKCQKTVYAAEGVSHKDELVPFCSALRCCAHNLSPASAAACVHHHHQFHKTCFRCAKCNALLRLNHFRALEGVVRAGSRSLSIFVVACLLLVSLLRRLLLLRLTSARAFSCALTDATLVALLRTSR